MSKFTESATNWLGSFAKSSYQRRAEYSIGGGNITMLGSTAEYPMEERAINTLATHFSKLKINFYYNKEELEYKDVEDELAYLLKYRPNQKQNVVEFWHTFFYNLYNYNFSAIIPEVEIKKMSDGTYRRKFISLQVLDMQSVSLSSTTSKSGEEYLIINNLNQEKIQMVKFDDVVFMRAFPQSIFNDETYQIPRNDIPKIINESLSVLISELESNFDIAGVVSVGNSTLGGINNTMVDDEIKRAKQEEILNRVKNKLIVLDAGESFTKLETNFKKTTISDIGELQNLYYNFFGIPKKIIDLTYTQEEFQPFVNSTIIPKIEALEYELNAKLLTKTGRTQGKYISVSYLTIDAFSVKEFVNASANWMYNGAIGTNFVRRAIGEKPQVGGDITYGNKNQADLNGQIPKTQQGNTVNEPNPEKVSEN